MSRYWNDGDWSDYEDKSVGWGLLLLLFILARLKSMNLNGLTFVKKASWIWSSLYDRSRVVDFFVLLLPFFLSWINLDWFFNRDQQQINKVDWICHRKQHFGPKLARPRNRLLCHFIPPLHTPSPPSGMRFFLSIVHPFLLFRLFFVCCLLSELFTYFLSFLFSLPSRSCRYGSSCQTLS